MESSWQLACRWSRLGGLLVGGVVESSWRLVTSSLHLPLIRGMGSPTPLLSGRVVPEESVEPGCYCCGGLLLGFGVNLLRRLSGVTGCSRTNRREHLARAPAAGLPPRVMMPRTLVCLLQS